jgi:hypothetical protein
MGSIPDGVIGISGPGFNSASTGNEHQGYSWGVKVAGV